MNMYQYNFIVSELTKILTTLTDTEYSEEERIAYAEGATTCLVDYLTACKSTSEEVKVIGGIWNGK